MSIEKLLMIFIILEALSGIGMWLMYVPYTRLKAAVKAREEAYIRNSEMTLKTIDMFIKERSESLEKMHNLRLEISELQKLVEAYRAKDIQ